MRSFGIIGATRGDRSRRPSPPARRASNEIGSNGLDPFEIWRRRPHRGTTLRYEVALLDLKSKMPLQKLPESAAVLMWPPVSLVDTLVSEQRFSSPSGSPSRPPVARSSRTVLLIAVPPSCRLSFCPLCF